MIWGCEDMRMRKCAGVGMCRCGNVRMCRCANKRMREYADERMYGYVDVRMEIEAIKKRNTSLHFAYVGGISILVVGASLDTCYLIPDTFTQPACPGNRTLFSADRHTGRRF